MHDKFKLNNLSSFNFLTLREVNAWELLKWILLFVKYCKSTICILEYYLKKCYKILVDVGVKTFKVNKKYYQKYALLEWHNWAMHYWVVYLIIIQIIISFLVLWIALSSYYDYLTIANHIFWFLLTQLGLSKLTWCTKYWLIVMYASFLMNLFDG